MKKPNIIFIICHDLGRHLGSYHKLIESPNLDEFASNGVRFSNAFCSSTACSPSRSCIMTGKYAHNSGGIGLAHLGWPLPQEQRTIVDYFNESGYDTAHFGLSHERHPGENHYQTEGEKKWTDLFVENAVDKSIKYLEDNIDSNKPFYLNIGMQEVHNSGWMRCHGEDNPRVKDYGPLVSDDRLYMPGNFPDVPQLRYGISKQQTAIRHMDNHLGRLFDKMDTLGYFDNSVVIFTTDHGIPGARAKKTIYDKGMETAFLLRAPFLKKKGIVEDCLIENIDIAPTLLEMADIEIPGDIQGRSFAPLIEGERYTQHEEIFTEKNFHVIYEPMRSIRTNNYHYIRYFNEGMESWKPFEIEGKLDEDFCGFIDFMWPKPTKKREMEELFDIRKDPDEFNNLAAVSEYKSIKKDLSQKLDNWMKDTDDFILTGKRPKRYTEPGRKGFYPDNPNWAADKFPDANKMIKKDSYL